MFQLNGKIPHDFVHMIVLMLHSEYNVLNLIVAFNLRNLPVFLPNFTDPCCISAGRSKVLEPRTDQTNLEVDLAIC